ncbi:MAG TPA: pyridoxal-phosphate dependent enzyme [Anaerolineales bacterium]|nr:pyridoxal-phosphate dependent enzyme [Anaerolineales bacterium]
MTGYACLECGAPYPDEFTHICQQCRGTFSLRGPIEYVSEKIDPFAPGIWRWRDTFGLPDSAPAVSLGEGSTPLVSAKLFGRAVRLKMESANPTGSYKDRLAAPLVSLLKAHGITEAVEDSSGNAGAAFAAYCARAGIKARVFVPNSASGPKRAQFEAYGAEVAAVPGPRPNATAEVIRIANTGTAYASHALLPHGLAGIATVAYELVEQMDGEVPGTVLTPVGHGGLLLGVIEGFRALQSARQIEQLPHFVGIQAENNAPLWAEANNQPFVPRPTAAGGIAVQQPARMRELLDYVRQGVLEFVTVSEAEIAEGHLKLAKMGFYIEPTSAVVWGALKKTIGKIGGEVVAIISGHGLKHS